MPAQKNAQKRLADNATGQFRLNQLNQIAVIISTLEAKIAEVKTNQQKQLNLLKSVSLGLYDEVDKLSKKAPAELVTDLVLSQTNDVIRETKQLVTDDPYIQRITEFVPAGDNPQHRDAVVVLRQIRQGLERFEDELKSRTSNLESKLGEAKLLKMALDARQKGNDATQDYLERFVSHVSSAWVTHQAGIRYFDYARLDTLDLDQYFSL